MEDDLEVFRLFFGLPSDGAKELLLSSLTIRDADVSCVPYLFVARHVIIPVSHL